ncbi:hypothetical protein [Microbacterium sp. USTB-Y]|uniref:hypothetical protein n=1 Tax=Microbacterium sp. USTB-Y TaxID=2823692 RepID=UPI00203FBA6E|nr:hypothetical protein [Microbacterium sp. USTB-Y]
MSTDPLADGLPTSWSASVRATYDAIEDDLGDAITPEQASILYEACAMLAEAEALDDQVTTDGRMIFGYRGAQVLHPAIDAALRHRRAAVVALATIRRAAPPKRDPQAASRAATALVGARWGRAA